MTREEYEALKAEPHNYKVTVTLQKRKAYECWEDIDEYTEIETTDLDEASDTFDDLLDPQISMLFDCRRAERKPLTRRNLICLYVDGQVYEEDSI